MHSTNPKILVLDDDQFILSYIRAILKSYDDASFHARATDALDAIDSGADAPDIVILDLNMPEMDGIQLVSVLQDRNFQGSVILISGVDQRLLETSTAIVARHNIRVLGWLSKPVVAEKLLQLVSAWKPEDGSSTRPTRTQFSSGELSIAMRDGELLNAYQPKVDMLTGSVTGFEALVRWNHADKGIVGPDQFIPAAEESGLISGLTDLVLENALRDLNRWTAWGWNHSVAVNLSMLNLADPKLPDKVSRVAARYGIKPSRITLEVTESAIVDETCVAIDSLTRLRLKGFHVSIDDFGTGYSSMEKVRDIAFDQLKIDRGFVTSASDDSTKASIFTASLDLSRYLGMNTVAEGIETERDWSYVRDSGCQTGQGYYISKPLFAGDVPDWIGMWGRDGGAARAG